jgi:hypothetical protein
MERQEGNVMDIEEVIGLLLIGTIGSVVLFLLYGGIL